MKVRKAVGGRRKAGRGAERPPSAVYRLPSTGPASGFTLLELLVVMTIIGILAAIAVPALRDSPRRAQEASLRADLFTFRSVLDQYKGDKGNYPPDLETLIKDGYIRRIPFDPITKKADWVLTMEEEPSEPDDPNVQPVPGIIDVHSASKEKALDGTMYSEW